jgi:gamma-glutamyltranspeptidase/glutathione hydrolase
VALLEILNILENFSLIFYGPSVDSFHLSIEAQKMAFEDRAAFLGDPDFSKVPLEKLLSKDYAKKKAQKIKFQEVREVPSLVEEASQSTPANTSHISVWDAEGNIVSYTTTIEHIFGSAMVVPGWGFVLNNELSDFDAEPRNRSRGIRGIKGRLKPNAPEPEKRPRSSMCPIIVFKRGEPVLVAGSPGGSLIIPTVHEVVMNVADFRLPLELALAAPRFAARGAEVEAEPQFLEDSEIIKMLRKRGHRFREREPFGNAQAIFFDEDKETLVGVSDPRGEGRALGY